jgi:Beta-ketoacyl synthase, N-terminal domain
MTQLNGLPLSLPSSTAASELRFRIEAWTALGPGFEAHSLLRCSDVATQERPVPLLLRRRVTPIGQFALRAAYDLGKGADRFVFCSRHGEFQRTLNLLNMIVAREPTSPSDFSLSVHNALTGLLSMALKNTAGHTTIAAGADSLGVGFVEAVASASVPFKSRVLLVYFDEALPEPYSELDDHGDLGIAVALIVAPKAFRDDDLMLSFKPRRGPESPNTQVTEFIEFLSSSRHESTMLGSRMMWRWKRAG